MQALPPSPPPTARQGGHQPKISGGPSSRYKVEKRWSTLKRWSIRGGQKGGPARPQVVPDQHGSEWWPPCCKEGYTPRASNVQFWHVSSCFGELSANFYLCAFHVWLFTSIMIFEAILFLMIFPSLLIALYKTINSNIRYWFLVQSGLYDERLTAGSARAASLTPSHCITRTIHHILSRHLLK